MKILHDITSNFDNITSIVEIGSGYGGQCKVIKDYLDVEYTCIDQPNCLALCEAYLRELKVDANFMNAQQVRPLFPDLTISTYCISELDEIGINFYFDDIIKNSKSIYFIVGNYKEDMPRHKHLIKKCEEFFNISIHKESPQTTKHHNIIIIGKKI